MTLFVGLFDRATGALLLDCSPFAQGISFGSNQHGCESLSGDVLRPLYDAFRIYDAAMPELVVADDGLVIWRGRLEAPGLHVSGDGSGTKLQGFGQWNALNDIPYTAFWSSTAVADWYALSDTEATDTYNQRYEIDANNRLFIAPRKNEVFGTTGNAKAGALGFVVPDQSSRQIVGVQFDFVLFAPAPWQAICQSNTAGWGLSTSIWSLNGTGSAITGSVHAIFTGAPRIRFALFHNAADATYAGETGATYLRITNVRIVSSSANRVATVFAANRAAGTSVTATVGSTAGMYVGQRLIINSGGTSESVVVQSVTNSTQFVATFVNSYTTGQGVIGHQVLPQEIIADIVGQVSAANPTHLSSSTGAIRASTVDITDVSYEDVAMADVVTDLASQAGYQAGTWEDKTLRFEPIGTNSRAWYVDVDDLSLERSTDDLTTSAYATYEDANGRTLRTATTSTPGAATRAGVDRRRTIEGQTTNSTIATLKRDVALLAQSTPQPKATFSVDRIYDANGSRWPLWLVRAGDTLTLRNLPPGASPSLDALRTFRLTRTNYDADNNTLAIEPELPAASLDALIGGL